MYVTHSSLNGHEAAADTQESSADLMAKLMGDWSWRPHAQPKDPGYVYDKSARMAVQFTIDVREDYGLKANQMRLAEQRPWMVRRYDGRDLIWKPVRIGPRM